MTTGLNKQSSASPTHFLKTCIVLALTRIHRPVHTLILFSSYKPVQLVVPVHSKSITKQKRVNQTSWMQRVELTSIVLGIMCGLHRWNHCAGFIKEARGLPISIKDCWIAARWTCAYGLFHLISFHIIKITPQHPINLGLCQQSLNKTRCTIHD